MTTNRYLTRAQQRRLIAASVFYILLLYTRFTPRRNTRGWRPEKKGREAACAQAAPRVCLPSRPDGPEPEGASGQQHVDHCLGRFHIAHNVFDVVRGAVLAVSVRADPGIGFIVGVVSLVILFQLLQEVFGVVVPHFDAEAEVLPCGGVLPVLERPYFANTFPYIIVTTPFTETIYLIKNGSDNQCQRRSQIQAETTAEKADRRLIRNIL